MFGTLTPRRNRLVEPLNRFEREMEGLVERFFGPEAWWNGETLLPKVNVAETDKAYEVTADLPGLKPEEFTVEIKNGQVWITGEKKEEKEEKGKTFHRIERHHGQFRRVVPLPTPVAEEKVTAEYTNGVLRVTVPKTAETQTKHVAVKAT